MSVTDRTPSAGDVTVAPSSTAAGIAAGEAAAQVLREALQQRTTVRVVFASAPSQEQMVRTLAAAPGIDWSRVRSMHLDEYRGIDPEHRAGFGKWLADRLPEAAQPGLERIRSGGNAEDEIQRYTELLREGPVDMVCLGIGVNGHVAFNEPGDTDFESPVSVREVALAHASRKQQVDEGLFASLDEVPTHALSMTVPAIVRGEAMICTVLGEAKASAVAAALSGPVTAEVPASVLRNHSNLRVFLDEDAAADLPDSVATHQVPVTN